VGPAPTGIARLGYRDGMDLVRRMRHHGTTIFTEISALAQQYDAVNLGQGFPDTDGPVAMLAEAARAIGSGQNQYPPLSGRPELLDAIAAHQRHWYGVELDPASEVLVTVGATEAIAATVLAFCEPGDEVVMFEPYYDSYAAVVDLAGAVRRTVVLRFPDFAVDEAALRAAFTPRTRLLLLNSPHNPTGKVFTRAELELIGRIAAEHGCWVVTDEVYEHLTFGVPHVPLASLPGMGERTLTVSSAGKTFSATGWKVGWVSGPSSAVTAVRTVKQFLTFGVGGPFQLAAALALSLPDATFFALRDDLQAKRDLLVDALGAAGLRVAVPDGTYFVVADAAPLGVDDAIGFARTLPARAGVAAIPVQAFHDDPAAAPTLLRFAFCKRDEVLRDGAARLARLAGVAGGTELPVGGQPT
jgi:N-succinyldiaminopimelate aminotransferase